ncbi:MAG: hypothetical protein KDI30_06385 [Pseudomonadales bacterium]|nr:hypothetical protein [Pseudomonadales bacterium]
MYKEVFSLLAIALSFLAFAPYIRSIRLGNTKPHVFSWVIWSVTTLIVFFAQLADGAGVGAWAIGLSGAITLYVTFLACVHQSDRKSTVTDRVFLVAALFSVPLWYFTEDPLWAVVLLTVVDSLGFGPTFGKAYDKPFEENMSLYVITVFRNFFVIAALENYSMTTVLFPAAMSVFSILLIGMVMLRRKTWR